jgi:hypothetical protein
LIANLPLKKGIALLAMLLRVCKRHLFETWRAEKMMVSREKFFAAKACARKNEIEK